MALLSANATLKRWEPQTARAFLIRVAGKLLSGAWPMRMSCSLCAQAGWLDASQSSKTLGMEMLVGYPSSNDRRCAAI
jgi:hypothetical protein